MSSQEQQLVRDARRLACLPLSLQKVGKDGGMAARWLSSSIVTAKVSAAHLGERSEAPEAENANRFDSI